VVSPASATVTEGKTQQFTATTYDQFGNLFGFQPHYHWSVENGGDGTISLSGLFQASSTMPGEATVDATALLPIAIGGDAEVTVISPAPILRDGAAAASRPARALP
jgi:hypothetical protein